MNVGMCSQPWFEMQVQYDTQVRPCCYYSEQMYAWDFALPCDVQHLWNSTAMMITRAVIANDLNTGSPCADCQFIRFATKPSFLTIDDEVNELQRSNWEAAIRNYQSRELIVNSSPVKYYFNFGLACNLTCIMCCQMDQRDHNKNIIPVERILEMKPYLVRANEIVVIGGEPLAMRQAQILIETMAEDPDFSNVKLTILTNATLLDRFMPLLRRIRRLKLMVSLDSIGDAYEQIRQGARWDITSKNVLNFKNESLDRNGLWSIAISGIVMKSSIPKLDEFVYWCTTHDIQVCFGPIVDYPFTVSENVFKYPELLADLPGWEAAFDNAIDQLDQMGWIETGSGPLRLMKEQLIGAWHERFGTVALQNRNPRDNEQISITSSEPLISIIMYVKDSMPYVQEAVTSILAQTYRNIELIILAGKSCDGTAEYLNQLAGIPNVSVEQVHDDRRGLAYNSAFQQVKGSITCILNPADTLDNDAVATIVQLASEHPECAAIYGSAAIYSEDGGFSGVIRPTAFDLTGLLEGDFLPPSVASFFMRRQCGEQWWIDEQYKLCCDYDLWLRISNRPIYHSEHIFGRIRRIGSSQDKMPRLYRGICEEKIIAIDSYLHSLSGRHVTLWLRNRAYAGTYMWAAEELLMRNCPPTDIREFVELSRQFEPKSVRLYKLNEKMQRYS